MDHNRCCEPSWVVQSTDSSDNISSWIPHRACWALIQKGQVWVHLVLGSNAPQVSWFPLRYCWLVQEQHNWKTSLAHAPWLASFCPSNSSILVQSVLEFVHNFRKLNPPSLKIALARRYNQNASSSVLAPEIVINICGTDIVANKHFSSLHVLL